MKRRDFLKSSATVSSGAIFSGVTRGAANDKAVSGEKPNILFILVDELRFPTVFPNKIKTPGEFLAKHMPHVSRLWERGVKFGNYHTAANACTRSHRNRPLLTTDLADDDARLPAPSQPVASTHTAKPQSELSHFWQTASPGRQSNAVRREVARLDSHQTIGWTGTLWLRLHEPIRTQQAPTSRAPTETRKRGSIAMSTRLTKP
jgi:hypothetical protein